MSVGKIAANSMNFQLHMLHCACTSLILLLLTCSCVESNNSTALFPYGSEFGDHHVMFSSYRSRSSPITISLRHSFDFFCKRFSNLKIFKNGFIDFEDATNNWSLLPSGIPDKGQGSNAIIAPFLAAVDSRYSNHYNYVYYR